MKNNKGIESILKQIQRKFPKEVNVIVATSDLFNDSTTNDIKTLAKHVDVYFRLIILY